MKESNVVARAAGAKLITKGKTAGSFKDYFLRVPPAMQTAREAVAWTFGKTPEEYEPRQEM